MKLHGNTVEEKLASAEKVLQQQQRQMSRKVVGLRPAVPILYRAQTADASGLLFEGISPINGTVTRLALRLGQIKNTQVLIQVRIHAGERVYGFNRVCKKNVEMFEVGEKIKAGDVAEIYCEPPDGATGVLIGILISPDPSDMKQDKYVLEQLLELEEHEDAVREPTEETQEARQEERQEVGVQP